ncbi:hypothetical protein ACNS7O_05210 [Haloferacaceae archaeon DSL9]
MRADTLERDGRNAVMIVVAVAAVLVLGATAVEAYQLLSYASALFIVCIVGVASIERNDREFDLSPYRGLVLGFAALFAVGFTGIWAIWSPATTAYTYALGIPLATGIYFVFIWLLPILGSIYYSLVFDAVGDEAIVDDIVDTAREIQREQDLPLSPVRPTAGEADRSTEDVRATADGGVGAADGDGGSNGGERR